VTLGVDICRNSTYMEEDWQLLSNIAYRVPGDGDGNHVAAHTRG
jgi:hypothetical protein